MKFYVDTHTNLVYSHSGYGIISCSQSAAYKMELNAAWNCVKTDPAGKESNNSPTVWRKITAHNTECVN